MNNELTKKQKDLLNLTKDKSLTAKVTSLKDKIAKMSQFKDKVILCDVSGSMATYIGDSKEVRAIDVVNSVLENFQGAKLWEFSNDCKLAKNGKLAEPHSGTNMAGAFSIMKKNSFKEILLITDGAPDSKTAALDEAKGLKINIIYIGPQPTPAFLLQLAGLTGGQFVDVELLKLNANEGAKELENKIKGFLNA